MNKLSGKKTTPMNSREKETLKTHLKGEKYEIETRRERGVRLMHREKGERKCE